MVNYEFEARTYYPRRISKSGSDAPLTLHYGIALSVIITNYNRLHPGTVYKVDIIRFLR